MTMPQFDIPNVSGKTVESIMLNDDSSYGREVAIRFTDHTELSINIECKQAATIRHFDVKSDQTLFESDGGTL